MGQRSEYHLSLKEEPVEGVDSGPVVGDVLSLVENPTITPTVSRSEGRQAPGTQARDRSIAGRSEKTVSGAVWLAGSRALAANPSITPEPSMAKLWKAAGFRAIRVDDLTYVTFTGAHTGVFVRGEAISWDGGGAGVAVNFGVPRSGGGTTLVISGAVIPVQPGDTVVGATSGASATASALSVYSNGWQYVPTSRQTVLVTATHANWTSAAPVAGDILVRCNTTASAQVVGFTGASATILSVTGTGSDPRVFEVDAIFGGFAVGQRVTYVSAASGAMYAGGGAAPTVSVVAVGEGASYSAHILTPLMKQRILGARGTVGVRGQAGEACQVNFELRGTMETHQAGTLYPSPVFDEIQNVPRLELAAVLLQGWPLGGQTFEYSHNAVLAPQVDYHGPSGIKAVRRTGRDPKFSLDPELLSPLTFDPFELLKSGNTCTLAAQIGYQAANQFLYVVDYGEVTNSSYGERDGQIVTPIEISCRRNPSVAERDVYMLAL